jgi:hypothetical protein
MSKNMQPENCRHEYVKIFQRKYKGLGRRLVSTRGYLPVGFGVKDFTHLSYGSFCFCTSCRLRLFPTRVESTKEKTEKSKQDEIQLSPILPTVEEVNPAADSWAEESGEEIADNADPELQVVNVEELQLESVEVSDITDKNVIVNGEDNSELEEGEE